MNLFSSCFRLLYCVISDSWVCTGYLTRQRGQENQVIITLQLSMSIATMEEEIVCVCVIMRLNLAMRQRFLKHRLV